MCNYGIDEMPKQMEPTRKRKVEVLHEQTFSDDRKAACSAMNAQANEMAVKAKLALDAKLLKKRRAAESSLNKRKKQIRLFYVTL